MTDPHTAQGVARMLPGSLGGQSQVASPITIIRRRTVITRAPPLVVRFDFTGAAQSYTVPAGFTVANFHLSSPKSGLGVFSDGSDVVALGMAVTPGDVFAIYCGGVGSGPTDPGAGAGGWNGGGDGADVGDAFRSGIGGCGATDVRFGGSTLADRIVVAGGGGGQENDFGGSRYAANTLPDPGAGGDPNGHDGDNLPDGAAGKGGTQLAGGAAGVATGWLSGTAGALGVGGTGGGGVTGYGAGSGGGGGYYGGGGGAGDAGLSLPPGAAAGGGSSWADLGVFSSVAYSLFSTPTSGIVIITLLAD